MILDLDALGSLGASLARAGLPTLATILSDAAPFPLNLFVRPAFAAVAAALGDDPRTAAPAAVQAKVDADPAAAAVKLQPVESAHATAVQEARIDLENVEHARSTELELVRAGSALQWVPAAWTLVAIVGFVGVIAGLMVRPVDFSANQTVILNVLLGVLTAEIARCGGFWMGASQSSRMRADQAIAFAAKAPPPAAPAARRGGR